MSAKQQKNIQGDSPSIDLAREIITQLNKYLPCQVSSDKQNTNTGVWFHTNFEGIKQKTDRNMFDINFTMLVYAPDPIEVESVRNTETRKLEVRYKRDIPVAEQKMSIFTMAALTSTWYCLSDSEGKLGKSTPYKRSSFRFIYVNTNQGLQKLDRVFPSHLRSFTTNAPFTDEITIFLAGKTKLLPQKDDQLQYNSNAPLISSRSNIMGRGEQETIRQTHKKRGRPRKQKNTNATAPTTAPATPPPQRWNLLNRYDNFEEVLKHKVQLPPTFDPKHDIKDLVYLMLQP